MTIHVLSDPSCPTGPQQRVNYFAYDCYKFIKHLHKEFNFIHYGLKGSEVDCPHHDLPEGIQPWNMEANRLIGINKEPGDIILCFQGCDNMLATQGHEDCKIVEPHIGYRAQGVFAPYRVFTSYAQMHYFYGMKGIMFDPSWFDAVIYNAITPSEFEFSDNKKDFALILGRVQADKGIHVAIQATDQAKCKLVIAGTPRSLKSLGYNKVPKHVELVGHVDPQQRKALLRDAFCLLAPTYYLEPFGCMVAEAQMSGTPTITTDWGAFPEINQHGVTGYRCRNMPEFVDAIRNCKDGLLDRYEIAEIAMTSFSDKVIYPQFAEYLKKVAVMDFYKGVGTYTTTTPKVQHKTQNEATRGVYNEIESLAKDYQKKPFLVFKDGEVVEVSVKEPTADEYKKWVEVSLLDTTGVESKGEFIHSPDPWEPLRFTVIIPTMDKAEKELREMLSKYEECNLVGEILIVDNGPMDFLTLHYLLKLSPNKLRILYSGPNIYVNPAWNIAAKQAKYPNLLFANDDINITDLDGILQFMLDNIQDGEVIGIDITDMNRGYYTATTPEQKEYPGWGSFYAMKRDNYVPIPDDIKIYCGDNIQWVCNKPLILHGAKGEAKQRTTTDSDPDHFFPIMDNDHKLFAKWYEKRFNDTPIVHHFIMSSGRYDYLERTLEGMKNLDTTGYQHKVHVWEDLTDLHDEEKLLEICNKYDALMDFAWYKPAGLSVSWRELWKTITHHEYATFDYIIMQEDDVVLVEPIKLQDWIDILQSDKRNAGAVLLRQAWYEGEKDPEPTENDEFVRGYRLSYEHNIFSPMCTLIKKEIVEHDYKLKENQGLHEGMILYHHSEMRMVNVRSRSGHRMIEHIGEVSVGKILSEGDQGYGLLGEGKRSSRTGQPVTDVTPKFTIGYIAHDEDLHWEYLGGCLAHLQTLHRVISKPSTTTPAILYNQMYMECETPFLILCHQDITFPNDILERITETIALLGNDFGVLGAVGRNTDNRYIWSEPGRVHEVDTLDPCFIVIKAKQNVWFDDVLFNDLHGYVEDYCAQMNRVHGKKNYTLLIKAGANEDCTDDIRKEGIVHYSATCSKKGYYWGRVSEYRRKLEKKWGTIFTTVNALPEKLSEEEFLRIELENGISPDNPEFVDLAERTIKATRELIEFTSVLDYGAGVGVYADAAQRAGCYVAAYDIYDSHVKFMKNRFPNLHVISHEQWLENRAYRPADLILTLFIEVAEHMTDAELDTFFSQVVSPYILFSSTPHTDPKDVEWGHINIKQKHEWIALFESKGYKLLCDAPLPTPWSMIFENTN